MKRCTGAVLRVCLRQRRSGCVNDPAAMPISFATRLSQEKRLFVGVFLFWVYGLTRLVRAD